VLILFDRIAMFVDSCERSFVTRVVFECRYSFASS
jgi:hypothetical protein